MKYILPLVALIVFSITAVGQTAVNVPYQGLLKNSAGGMLVGQPLLVRITIRDGSATGAIVYRETHTTTTAGNGSFDIKIGAGTPVSGTFSSINWLSSAKYKQVEIDTTATGASFADMGAAGILYVPLAVNAKTAEALAVSSPAPLTGSVYTYNGTSWAATVPTTGWVVGGNTGTDTSNFIGTRDSRSLFFRVGNVRSGFIDWNSSTANTAFGRSAMSSASLTGTGNTAFGNSSLRVNTTGSNNTAAGSNSLYSNTTGLHNSAFGDGALYTNTIGSANTAIGFRALESNSGGNYNTAIGTGTLAANNGSHNTATGNAALSNNTTGSSNTAIGSGALYINSTGSNNTALGWYTLHQNTTGSNNIALGYNSLYSNVSGAENTALGRSTLQLNTGGRANTAVGDSALYSNSVNNNTAIGYASLSRNTGGTSNSAQGIYAMYKNTTGGNNSASGAYSLYSNTTGNDNAVLGIAAMYANSTGNYNVAVGSGAMYSNTAGSYNTAVGLNALRNSNGDFNVAVGRESASLSSYTSVVALGNYAQPTANNTVVIGSSAISAIGGYANWSNLSDGRYKSHVTENVPGLDFILKLRAVTYQFEARKLERELGRADSTLKVQATAYDKAEAIVRTGFIAQEVETAARETNYDFSGVHRPENEHDHYTLAYGEFVVPLVKSVQEMYRENKAQAETIKLLQQKVAQLEQQSETIKLLQQKMEQLEQKQAK